MALGFFGVMVARRGHGSIDDLAAAAVLMFGVFVAVTLAIGFATGLGFGWIGALDTPSKVWSWVSPAAELGQLTGVFGVVLGLGNHTGSIIGILSVLGYPVTARSPSNSCGPASSGATGPSSGSGSRSAPCDDPP